MAEDEIKAFWRDDVNLWIHRPAVRIAVWLGVLSGLVLIAIGVYLVGKSLLPELTAYAISTGLSLVTGLGAFAGELYYEGGKSAAKLKSDNARALADKDKDRDAAVRNLMERVAAVEIERDAALAACEVLKKPKKQRGDRNDVIKKFQRLVDAGKKINPPSSMAVYNDWRAQIELVVRECFDEHWANDALDIDREILRIQDANDREKAKRLLPASMAKIQGWIGQLRDGKADHCIREFYVEVQT